VGRVYSGVLGPLAMATVVARSIRHGWDSNTTLLAASLCLLAFALAGYVLGRIAESTVEDSVQARIAAELASREAGGPEQAAP